MSGKDGRIANQETTIKPKEKDTKPVRETTSETVSPLTRSFDAYRQFAGNRALHRMIASGELQAKLRISSPGDYHEKEADKVADNIVGIPQSHIAKKPIEEEDDDTIQAKEEPGQTINTDDNLESRIKTGITGGRPLSRQSRDYFEPRFNHDFSGVRVHTDSRASTISRSINARAFTLGNNIAFARGEYQPDTRSGKKLLAHELTHVVQQGGGAKRSVSRKAALDTDNGTDAGAAAPITAPEAAPGEAHVGEQEPMQEPALQQLDVRFKPAKEENKPPAQKRSPTPTVPVINTTGSSVNIRSTPQVTPVSSNGPSRNSNATSSSSAGDLVGGFKTTPAVESLKAYNHSARISQDMMNKEAEAVNARMPEIPAPTGMPGVRERPAAPSYTYTKSSVPDTFKSKQTGKVETNEQIGPDPALFDNAEAGHEVPTSMGARPDINLSGEANPEQVGNFALESAGMVSAQVAQAAAEINRDFGENNVLPTVSNETISPGIKVKAPQVAIRPIEMEVQAVPAEVYDSVNKDMGASLNAQVEAEVNSFEEAQEQYESEKTKAQEDSLNEIKALEDDTRAKQQAEQDSVKDQVNGYRDEWKNEVETVDQNFRNDAQKLTEEQQQQIAAEKKDSDKKIEDKFSDAKQDAEKERKDAEEAAQKEAENKPKTLLDHVGELAGEFVKFVQSAVMAIFDQLRSAVKWIFDQAKNFALDVIEQARQAIVEFIKFAGDAMKGLVSFAFAAFPEIAEKINAKIDNAVETAVTKVNEFADTLKERVTQVFDTLASIVDSVLGFFQAAFDFVFTAVGMLVRGEFAELGRYIFESALKLIGAGLGALMDMLGINEEDVMKIISDPGLFFRNLVEAIKQGLNNFVSNILTHLRNGLFNWLFGTFAEAGITMPEKFNLAGIFHLIAQIFGLTWGQIRAKLVKRIGRNGEAIVSALETAFDFVKTLITKGPIALWEKVKEGLSNLKDMVFGVVVDWVRNKIIVMAVTKLATMFNPVGAIIQLIQGIYNTAMFFYERWQQIRAFAQSVFESIKNIAEGKLGPAAAYVEKSLANTIPIMLGFFARLLGLGGIAKKIKSIIDKIRKPVDKVVDKVIDWLVTKGEKIWKSVKGLFGKGEEEQERVEAPQTQEEHDEQVKQALAETHQLEDRKDTDNDDALTYEEASSIASTIKAKYEVFSVFEVVDGGDSWDYAYRASPDAELESKKKKKAKTVNPRVRLPRTNGKWVGEPGNGEWYSDKPEVKSVTKGDPVVFSNNRPNFAPWKENPILTFNSGELNGTNKDFDLIYKKLQDKMGFTSKNRARLWLRTNGLTPHHKTATLIELIPTKLHKNIPHIGSASDLRGV